MGRPDLAGRRLDDRYDVEAQVGSGAMGTVWRARDRATGTRVAIKVLDEGRGHHRAARFHREARAMARLHSPYVVRVLGHGRCDDPAGPGELSYLTMELLEGESLRRRLNTDRRLPPAVTAQVVAHVGRGIALAHARGIVHRDLKPENVFLSGPPPFHARVLDFGLAKPLVPLPSDHGLHTQVGRPLGTPYYMSPEQCQGLPRVDHRTDLWALGAITFECLVGRRLFEARTVAELFSRIQAGHLPSMSELVDVPPAADAWLARALARDVQDRFQSASAMIAALLEALDLDDGSLVPPLAPLLAEDALHTRVMVSHAPPRTARWAAPVATHLVGRDRLIAEVAEAFASHARVVCLYGHRGSGRGAIAEAHAATQRGDLSGGVWRVPLATAESAQDLKLAIACALDTRIRHDDGSLATALSSLGPALVVLEDADRVRAPLAALVARAIREAPHVSFIVTANRPLEAPAERALAVPHFGEDDSPAWLAAELLTRRSDHLGGTDETRPIDGEPPRALVEGAAALGGNALVLSLAADAWVRSQGPALSHVAEGIAGVGDAHSLAAIDAILDTLDPEDRALLTRCGGFRSAFTAEQIESLGNDRDRFDDLVRRGFVERDGSARRPFALHPLLRRVAARRLASGRDVGGRGAARAWLEQLARQAAELGTRDRLLHLARVGGASQHDLYLDALDDARVSAQRMRAAGQEELASRCEIVAACAERLLGANASAIQRLRDAPARRGSPAWLDRTWLAARLAMEAGDAAAAREQLRDALELVTDPTFGIELSCLTVDAALAEDRQAEARHFAVDAHQRATAVGDDVLVAEALLRLARCELLAHEPEAARPRLERAHELFATAGAPRRLGATLELLARVAAPSDVRHLLEQALDAHRLGGDRLDELSLLQKLAPAAEAAGDLDQALAWLDEALQTARELGERQIEVQVSQLAAQIHRRAGRTSRAGELLARVEAMRLSLEE
ncbi:MAG: protein kinase [Polyangiaceae bacterium]